MSGPHFLVRVVSGYSSQLVLSIFGAGDIYGPEHTMRGY